MFNIAIMDSDSYIKCGVAAYFKSDMTRVSSSSNVGDLTINLENAEVDIVMMELFSRDDSIFDCIEFVRVFSSRWPKSKLVIYTQIMNDDTIKLLASVTGQNDVVLKSTPITALATSVFSPWKGNFLRQGLVG